MRTTEDWRSPRYAALFWAKVDKTDGCWLWTGHVEKDYGRVGSGKNRMYAHVRAFLLSGGVIPEGKQLDHLCRTTICCRPDHLEPVTCRENLLRSPETWGGKNKRKTHCPQSNPYSGVNKEGRRICHVCQCAAQQRYRERAARRDGNN